MIFYCCSIKNNLMCNITFIIVFFNFEGMVIIDILVKKRLYLNKSGVYDSVWKILTLVFLLVFGACSSLASVKTWYIAAQPREILYLQSRFLASVYQVNDYEKCCIQLYSLLTCVQMLW